VHSLLIQKAGEKSKWERPVVAVQTLQKFHKSCWYDTSIVSRHVLACMDDLMCKKKKNKALAAFRRTSSVEQYHRNYDDLLSAQLTSERRFNAQTANGMSPP
jgi:hypothetical protein